MTLQFKITFKSGHATVLQVVGKPGVVSATNLTVDELFTRTIETEQFLEKILGYRVHIESVPESEQEA